MIDFIQSVTKGLGVDESTARSATGRLLGFIKGQLDPQTFEKLASALPGAAGMVGAAPQGQQGGGLLGNLTGQVAARLGGGLGGTLELTGMLGQSGLDAGQAGSFVKLFADFVKQKVGPDTLQAIMEKVPQLGKLMA